MEKPHRPPVRSVPQELWSFALFLRQYDAKEVAEACKSLDGHPRKLVVDALEMIEEASGYLLTEMGVGVEP